MDERVIRLINNPDYTGSIISVTDYAIPENAGIEVRQIVPIRFSPSRIGRMMIRAGRAKAAGRQLEPPHKVLPQSDGNIATIAEARPRWEIHYDDNKTPSVLPGKQHIETAAQLNIHQGSVLPILQTDYHTGLITPSDYYPRPVGNNGRYIRPVPRVFEEGIQDPLQY